ncbi:ABC transporter ATP-binding protein [Aquisalimonas asiatica]|uniref:Carbohydrate ABC transporter ATP-binding protein, CUT1 family n=1 Tax=Aquisalimonas asiatica TaxID=406100 RepID=A0A1H8RK43_9GAMM|nr:sn-glycerol-3-phosphate ABC transporter ATP-binding protein UgpC [Aquisalimonas asiatica]SEO66702.1 carbohydrate ABC transporter ATP-binding protein, CUT1 family [Aquisalimonas asiatica]
MAAVTMRNIAKRYDGDSDVIKGVDLDISDGEFVVLVGPSGCGKSTMLRMIAGLEDISDGELLIDGTLHNRTPPARRGVAMVFQSYALYPHMNVRENMGFALKLAGHSRQVINDSVNTAADILQINHLLERRPKELSGGQRQRVAIGRAITRKPEVFLFDEPLSNLDASLRVQMRIELMRLHRELGTTMIYVTHDQVEAMTLGDRVVVFNHGVIEQSGPPAELYARPTNQFVGGFLGSPKMNLLPCRLEHSNGATRAWLSDSLALPVPYALSRTDCPATVGIRPEHFELTDAENGAPASVEVQENLGDYAILHARLRDTDQIVSVKLTETAGHYAPGDVVALRAVPEECHYFDEAGPTLRVG